MRVVIRVAYVAPPGGARVGLTGRSRDAQRWVSASAGAGQRAWSTTSERYHASRFTEADAAAWVLAHQDEAASDGWSRMWTEPAPTLPATHELLGYLAGGDEGDE